MDEKNPTRREVVKTALYLAPAIITLAAAPSFATAGSGEPKRKKHWPHPTALESPYDIDVDTDD